MQKLRGEMHSEFTSKSRNSYNKERPDTCILWCLQYFIIHTVTLILFDSQYITKDKALNPDPDKGIFSESGSGSMLLLKRDLIPEPDPDPGFLLLDLTSETPSQDAQDPLTILDPDPDPDPNNFL